ncbi:4'-phosphopantetheinyl transferase [Micromonospora sagamiensis]|uniref:4'-phosphopantetheinyl transferase n=1 Tax=Micromonospora sagamiensis TaxID=47875 RepID=A0A562WH59_9ACTN|nr:4'-phosphopantetheinyl transferase [Micromonospora sagamiensis]
MPGRDTVYVWISRTCDGQSEVTRRLLVRAGVALLGRDGSEISVEREAGGRPRVRGNGVELPVSVSHVDGVVAVAACRDAPVGVDVERHRPVPAVALARRWFEPAAVAWLRDRPAGDRAEGFLLLWTAKEAVGKALGVGLRDGGLTRPVPRPDGVGPLLRPVPGDGGLWVGHPPAGPGLVLAVAVGGVPREVVVVDAGGPGHEVAARSTSVARTSLPVVVRGSWSSRCRVRGRL